MRGCFLSVSPLLFPLGKEIWADSKESERHREKPGTSFLRVAKERDTERGPIHLPLSPGEPSCHIAHPPGGGGVPRRYKNFPNPKMDTNSIRR